MSHKLKKTVATIIACLSLTALNAGRATAEPVWSENSEVGKALNLPVCDWKDDTVPPKAIIFAMHGATLYAKTFADVAKHFASEGYPFYALDMRGFGRWRQESATFGGDTGIHYTQTKLDMLEALGMLRRTYPNLKIYCLGESLGANMAVWLLTNKPELVDGAILSSPCIKRIVHVTPRLISDFTKGFFHPYRGYDMKPHIEPYLSDDQRVTSEYINDPMINRLFSAADLIKSMRTNNETLLHADKIDDSMPLLVVAGKLDQVYKASAIPDFMKKVGSKDKTIFIAPNKGHLLLETGHTEPKILAVIDNWLQQERTSDAAKTSNRSQDGAKSSLNEKGSAANRASEESNDVSFIKSTQAKVISKKETSSASKEISAQSTSSKSTNRTPD